MSITIEKLINIKTDCKERLKLGFRGTAKDFLAWRHEQVTPEQAHAVAARRWREGLVQFIELLDRAITGKTNGTL